MTKPFIHEDFLLLNDASRELYHTYAKAHPILDYHCHLPPQDVANNRRFSSIAEIWLEGDHYKWRAMRANGIPESHCTGKADPYEKFLAWAKTVPVTLRNPLYHWTHLELKRTFGIETLLSETTAQAIWEEANRQIAGEGFCAHGLLRHFNVRFIGTTDDPADPLPHHEAIAKLGIETVVAPTFRPDKAFALQNPTAWNAWVNKLESTSGIAINSAASLLKALRARHDAFGELACRLSDHGLEVTPFAPCSDTQAEAIFQSVRSGTAASLLEQEQLATYILQYTARWNAEKGWAMQLHIGAIRNNRSALLKNFGPDSGCDSIHDLPQMAKLSAFLDSLDREGTLPKVILYNLNPADNYAFAAMMGNFQDGSVAGKIQYGSGWWFLDQREGMLWQLNALSSQGLLARFIGMLTDSRSFLSYPRHEYFRRILCNLLGEEMENGLLPSDMTLVGNMVSDICYRNAKAYLKL